MTRLAIRPLFVWLFALLFLLDATDAWGRKKRRRRRKKRRRKPPAKVEPAKAGPPPTHALKPLESIGVAKVRVNRTDIELNRVLGTVPGVRMVPIKKIKKFLKSKDGAQLAIGGAGFQCSMRFGAALKVQNVVAGDVTQLGKGYVLSLKLVDVKTKKVVRRVTVVVTGAKPKRQAALEEAAYKLLAPKLHTGKVLVAVDVKGAKIYLDGHMVATSPAPALSAAVGAHNLRVTHPSYHDYLRFLRVDFRKTLNLKVNLKAYPIISAKVGAKGGGHVPKGAKVIYKPLPWYRKWYVVTGIAVGALLLAGAVTTTAVALSGDKGISWDMSTVIRP